MDNTAKNSCHMICVLSICATVVNFFTLFGENPFILRDYKCIYDHIYIIVAHKLEILTDQQADKLYPAMTSSWQASLMAGHGHIQWAALWHTENPQSVMHSPLESGLGGSF
jgi:hypothetical protein